MGIYKLARVSVAVVFLLLPSGVSLAQAEPIHYAYVNKVVDAIYKAEGGRKTRHPYGILSVKTSNPRQTCFEVVNWRYVMWSSSSVLRKEPFLLYLSRSYCPLNDPRDIHKLNKNWVNNVRFFLE